MYRALRQTGHTQTGRQWKNCVGSRELQRAVNRFEAALERSHGICLNEGMALCSLSKAGRLSCGELGEMLGLTPSNTSKVLRSVEGKGYVNRELGTNDKRQIYFSLTEKAAGSWEA